MHYYVSYDALYVRYNHLGDPIHFAVLMRRRLMVIRFCFVLVSFFKYFCNRLINIVTSGYDFKTKGL